MAVTVQYVPIRVNICGIPHTIIEKEDAFDIDAHLGQINYKDCEIIINANMAQPLKDATICHEIMHGIFTHIGRNDLSSDEQLITTLGNAINQAFEIRRTF